MIDRVKLLYGAPIPCDGLEIRPLTLREIGEIGEQEYNRMLSLLLINAETIFKGSTQDGLSDYEAFIFLLLSSPEMLERGLTALHSFTGVRFEFDDNGLSFTNDHGVKMPFTEDTFKKMRDIVMCQNYLTSPSDEEKQKKFNPANKRAEELYKKLMERRKKIQEANKKKTSEEKLDLSDLISIVACYGDGVNLINIWDYTVYQLYESYVRLQIWDEYQITQSWLPHIDTEKSPIEIKHWSTKVDPNIIKEDK